MGEIYYQWRLFPFPYHWKLQIFLKINHRCLKEVISQLRNIFIIMNLQFKWNSAEISHKNNIFEEEKIHISLIVSKFDSCFAFWLFYNYIIKVLCYLQFLKNKICLNHTRSLLIINWSKIISKNNEDFVMERHFLLNFSLFSSVISLKKTFKFA